MKDILLLVAVMAFFAGGIPLMRRLDGFVNAHARPEAARPQMTGRCMRIGFADPLAAGCLTRALEAFSDQRRDVPVRLFSGAGDELARAFAEGQLDVALLPEGAEVSGDARGHVKKLKLERAPITTERGGFPVEPVGRECACFEVLWRNNPQSSDASCFVEYLKCSLHCEPSTLKSKMECDMMGARGQLCHWRSANGGDDSDS